MGGVFLALTPVLGLFVCLLVHVLLSRAVPKLSRPRGILLSAVAGGVTVAAMAMVLRGTIVAQSARGDDLSTVVSWWLAYLALIYAYVFGFFNVGESARRVRLLIELHEAGERGLTQEECLRAYNAEMIVDARLRRLLAGGQIQQRNGRYFIGHRLMLYVAKLFVLLKLVFFGSPSEFSTGGHAEHSMPTPISLQR